MLRSRSNTLKTNKSGVDMIFVLTVFVLFVCCLLAAVLTSLCASLQAQQQRLAEKLIRLCDADTEAVLAAEQPHE